MQKHLIINNVIFIVVVKKII